MRSRLKLSLVKITAALLCLLVSACHTVKVSPELIKNSYASPAQKDTSLNHFVSERVNVGTSENSAFFPVPGATDALGARLKIAEQAEQSLDVQYFLMKEDAAGFIFMDAILKAADRGVDVRLLLDDIFTTVPDKTLRLLAEHPKIDVRIFNPISRKGIYWFNYLGTFNSTNRRMHNKSFVADGVIGVVGGRNIGKEYFALEGGPVYADFDLIIAGPIVSEVSQQFDLYWNFEHTIPIEFLKKSPKRSLKEIRSEISEELDKEYDDFYDEAKKSDVLHRATQAEEFLFGTAKLITDKPEKVNHEKDVDHKEVVKALTPILEAADEQVVFINPYFIPGDKGVDLMASIVDNGKRVIAITNSLATNNHTSAQSAYAKYRKDLIRAGVELYELRETSLEEITDGRANTDVLRMHTKLIFIDDDQSFVGSLNLDPRSFVLNTEMGLLIDSASLNQKLLTTVTTNLERATYRLKLSEKGKIEWHGVINGEPVVKTKEPDTNFFKRVGKFFLKLAPESQL